MGKSYMPLRSRKERMKQSQEECSLIADGLVCILFIISVRVVILCEGNTRVISQTALDHFRTSLSEKKTDPYSVLLRRNKLPMALLDDAQNPHTLKARAFSI